jgi:hypothetical protein
MYSLVRKRKYVVKWFRDKARDVLSTLANFSWEFTFCKVVAGIWRIRYNGTKQTNIDTDRKEA